MMKLKTITKIVLLGGILPATFSSCGTTLEKYKKPEVNTEHLFRSNDVSDTTTIANVSWREFFKDPKLQALIEEGLNNSLDAKIALARIDEASAYFKSAKKAVYPNIGLAGQVTHVSSSYKDANGNVQLLSKNTNQYLFGIAATWEVDLWGKLSSTSKSKYALFLQSKEAYNLVYSNLVAGVASYYYTLLSLDQQLRITQESIDLLKQTVETMEAMKKAGLQNGASVEQTKATLYSTQASVPSIETAIIQTENSLNLLLGRNSGPIERSSFDEQEVPRELKYGTPFQMVANRPDVRSAELAFRSAFELKNVAQASFYPTLSLVQGSVLGFGGSKISNLFRPENIVANVISNLVQPIFAQGQLNAGLAAAKAEQKIAYLTFEKTVITAGNEVVNVLALYTNSLKKNESRTNQILALKNSVEYTQLLLKAGEANYLEVITAETNLLSAQLSQVDDKLEQLNASVNLYKALGGGTK